MGRITARLTIHGFLAQTGCLSPLGERGASRKLNISDALDAGEAHAVTIGNIPSLEWFQAIPNGKSWVDDTT